MRLGHEARFLVELQFGAPVTKGRPVFVVHPRGWAPVFWAKNEFQCREKTRESGVNPELPRSGIGNETHPEALSEELGKR